MIFKTKISAKLISNGELQISNFFSFLAAMMLAYQPVRSLATLNIAVHQGLSGAKRILPIIDEVPQIGEKKDYPNILITTSLSDSRVLFDEPTKYCAKLRDHKTDNNLLLFKCEMDAGHGSRSGRKNIIEDIAFDYAFALKIANKI